MAVFDWGETDCTADEKPRVNRARYGEGYEQRSSEGINPLEIAWQLSFADCSPERADEIMAFLRERAGVEAFDWTPKWETVAKRVVCPSWTRGKGSRPHLQTVSARFELRYEP